MLCDIYHGLLHIKCAGLSENDVKWTRAKSKNCVRVELQMLQNHEHCLTCCSLPYAYRKVFFDVISHHIFQFWSRLEDSRGKNLTILQINNVRTYMDGTFIQIVWYTKLFASCF